ncbi:LacI family DNA-binding transcriptional regulator [Streptomyces coffeae]|uniref:Substrate-binding domain-containing protein n=1 Tax=Streptomyces coffeae TaxID=621382 RepID=A0ABS1NP17_9ACTN|nr:substrate-binding domain-containing protein [Streptomyces coffeae]MBL1101758.1 substrate-binding domain-containing protein [Streptomyces coffeae]
MAGTTGGTQTGPDPARAHALGLVYPPAEPDGTYTEQQHDFIGGVAEAAARYDYDMLLSPSVTASEPSFRRMVSPGRVDGLIVMEIRLHDDRVEHLAKAGIPYVIIGRNSTADATGWVDLDFVGMTADCVQHLADLGHRRIAFVNRSERLFDSGYGPARLSLEGYTKAMAALGLREHAYLCGDDDASGEAVLEKILLDDPATTSLVTMNEAALRGVYLGLKRHGRVVPRDFSVVGVTAGRWVEQTSLRLSAIETPVAEMSRVAVDLLRARLISPGAPPRHVLLKPLVAQRDSTGPCRRVPGEEPDLEELEF